MDKLRRENCHIKFPRALSKLLEWGALVVLRGIVGVASRFLGYARNDMGMYGGMMWVAVRADGG